MIFSMMVAILAIGLALPNPLSHPLMRSAEPFEFGARRVVGWGENALDQSHVWLGSAQKSLRRSLPKKMITYRVVLGPNTGLDMTKVAGEIHDILGDDRGWAEQGHRYFHPVKTGRVDLQIVIATPRDVDQMCLPLQTLGYLSCRSGNRVILNVLRWNEGIAHWQAGLGEYRAYLINHEVGHFLGKWHRNCPKSGAQAPVMMQQTKSLRGCRANGWPYPARTRFARSKLHGNSTVSP